MTDLFRMYDRTGWESGPWTDEPDIIAKPPTLLYRQASGAWVALVGVDKSYRDLLARFVARQGSVNLDVKSRRPVIINFDEHSKGKQFIDITKCYVGFSFAEVGDCKPASTRYVKDLPEDMRANYLASLREDYVNCHRAQMYADLLARVLHDNKISVVNSAA